MVSGTIQITFLVEDTTVDNTLCAEHGLAVWLECEAGRVLFDTGQGDALMRNASQLGIDLSTVDAIVLSHGHYDHTGGLAAVLNVAPKAVIYAHPAALEPKYARADESQPRRIGIPVASAQVLASNTGYLVEGKGPASPIAGLHLTGEIPRMTDFEQSSGPFFLDEACTRPDAMLDDQALFFSSKDGLVLLAGCAHAGIINTMRWVAEQSGTDRFACVVGGFHLVGASDERIDATIEAFRAFDVQRIGLAHCTGRRAVARFMNAFPSQSFICHAGDHLEFPGPSRA